MNTRRSATVIGSGPNGLAAAITLARGGCDVTVLEAEATVGGGMRSGALTLPGFTHDICSAIHPLGEVSPFFRSLPPTHPGVRWIHAPAPLAHPLDDGTAVLLHRSVDDTAAALGADERAYRHLFGSLVVECPQLIDPLLAPLLPPRRPLLMARFGLSALRSAHGLAMSRFRGERARALFAGIAAHAVRPLEDSATASFGLVLGMLAHAWGWPLPGGGSQTIADMLAQQLRDLGGRIVTGHRVTSRGALDGAALVLFDTDPQQFLAIAGDRLPAGYRKRLGRFRSGPAAFKLDWALSGPIPWRAAECATAATVHLGGTIEEIAASEHAAAHGEHAERPFVLLTQPSLFDPTRAPAGQHTAWAYCHLPNGSTIDMTERIERQVERFAPGFRDLIIGRHVMGPAEIERHNANNRGGDIVGGSNELRQIFGRPLLRWNPYSTPVPEWFLCSASTPPGGGVHGMSGYHAATAALRSLGMS